MYGYFNDPNFYNESKEDGSTFKVDFPRTSEIELIINGESQIHHKISDSEVDKTNNQNEFIDLLMKQRPELARVIMQELNQSGALFTARILMEGYFFRRAAIESKDKHHHFIIDVANQDEVFVKETIIYRSLSLEPTETALNIIASGNSLEVHGFFSEEEQKKLESYRNSRRVQSKLRSKDDDGAQELVLSEGQPLSLTVQYALRYCEKTGTYEMKVPSKDDITLTVPTELAKRLVFDNKWTIGDKISEFIFKLVDVFKKLVIAKVSERTVTEQSRPDQAKPSEESQASSFAQRM
ncbi:hypothetical protein RVIR1_01220 [Candidatus Rickettsiella viridis]|uniref:Uncharacterized protein n=1 Tax=Candidatus Rickettsiella viridis TaxID=676208 RepID=A0A2Z5V2H3_9COXI|nr:hypothetical protein RVIR1_01220 [Candidatus Rickettsiella viridis]